MRHFSSLLSLAVLCCACSQPVMQELHETVTIDGDHGKLVGDIDRPEIAGTKAPVTIFYHGLTGFRSEEHINAVCDSIYAKGIAVIRFDFNGHGDSEGKFSDMTLDNEVVDAKAVYDYVASLPWVDTDRIAIAGHSQGGLVSSVVAGDLGASKIRCAVLLAPAPCIHTMAINGRLFGYDTNIENMPDSIAFWDNTYLGKQYMVSARDMDVFERSSHYDGATLVIQGLSDGAELIADSARYPEFIKDCTYVPLEGLTHCFPEDYGTPARLSAEFIAEHLK